MPTYTHTGCRPNTAYVHRGRMFGHTDRQTGKMHALSGGPRVYTALCGETVQGEYEDDWTGESVSWHVSAAKDGTGSGVTCKRCRKVLGI